MPEQPEVRLDEQAVRELIDARNVATFFQPVVSVATKSIVGFEAFSRGGADACALEPAQLFHADLSPELKVDVDRLCRERALKQFAPIHTTHKNLLLFLKVNPEILPHVDKGSMVLHEQVQNAGIEPANVVGEVPMAFDLLDVIAEYVDLFRVHGYRFCFDNCDVDSTASHIIGRFRPDFIKINRSFFAEDERTEYAGKTLETLLDVADKVGSRVIGQRVETEAESLRLLLAGVHLQQGYYYTKDEVATSGDPARNFFQKIADTFDKYKGLKRGLVRRKKERVQAVFKALVSICAKLENMTEDRFEDGCRSIVSKTEGVISMYVLSGDGIQITSRVHGNGAPVNRDAVLGTCKGSDHSAEDYVLYLDMGYEKFVTTPFSSPYTGEIACLVSRPFFSQDGGRYMACIELPYPG